MLHIFRARHLIAVDKIKKKKKNKEEGIAVSCEFFRVRGMSFGNVSSQSREIARYIKVALASVIYMRLNARGKMQFRTCAKRCTF